jgi:hypothetical protein
VKVLPRLQAGGPFLKMYRHLEEEQMMLAFWVPEIPQFTPRLPHYSMVSQAGDFLNVVRVAPGAWSVYAGETAVLSPTLRQEFTENQIATFVRNVLDKKTGLDDDQRAEKFRIAAKSCGFRELKEDHGFPKDGRDLAFSSTYPVSAPVPDFAG